MPQDKNRRRIYIINKVFQYRLLFSMAGVILLTVVLSHLMALAAAKWLNSSPASVRMAESIQATLKGGVSWDALWIAALTTVLIGIVLVLLFGRRYTNRIAGPLYNLRRVLAQVEGGDLRTAMHIRRHDEFHDVEDAFNRMVRGLNQRLQRVQQAILSLPEPNKSKALKILGENFSTVASAEAMESPTKSST
jgi:HAMP domain-containing protein